MALAIFGVMVGVMVAVPSMSRLSGGDRAASWREGERCRRWLNDAAIEAMHHRRSFTLYLPAGTLTDRFPMTWSDGGETRWWDSDGQCYFLSRRGAVRQSSLLPHCRMFVPGFTLEIRCHPRIADPPDCYVVVSPYGYVSLSATPPP